MKVLLYLGKIPLFLVNIKLHETFILFSVVVSMFTQHVEDPWISLCVLSFVNCAVGWLVPSNK